MGVRIWDVEPQQLCDRHLLGEHRELHAILLGQQYGIGHTYFFDIAGFVAAGGMCAPRASVHGRISGTRVGIPRGSLHVLRHTAATLALTATPPVPLHVVAGRLGDDPRTLLSTYAHLLPHSDEQAAEAVASALVDNPLTNSIEPDRVDAEIPANQPV